MAKPEIVQKLGDRICKLIDGDAAAQDIARLTEAYVKLITAEEAHIEPGATAAEDMTFMIDVPSELDMESIGKVSVFIWDGLGNIYPYCAKVSFPE